MTPLPRLAVITDFPEEGWPSMDLVAEMTLKHIANSDLVRAQRVCPAFRRPFGFLGGAGRNADRLANRMWHYPRYLRRRVDEFDLFHICDHSYAQLVHELPADRTGVLLHDLDTFRCLLEPEREHRPRWFRAMVRRILRGLQKARVVFYISSGVREQIERHGLIDPGRLVKAPVAAAAEFAPAGDVTPSRAAELVGSDLYIMHVGSCIPRKRIDVLLNVFERVRTLSFLDAKGLKLLQVGGEWTPEQQKQIERLKIGQAMVQLRGLTRETIADLYRHAAVVLQPSEAEGFGLPVVEALACGAAVVASDIPVLREVGGDAVTYCPVGEVGTWGPVVQGIVFRRTPPPALDIRLAQAAKYSWTEHARAIAETYRNLLPATSSVAGVA